MLFLMMMIDSEEERSKFELIYRTYRNLMFYVARDILNDDAAAEDAVQEAFVRIIEKINKISEAKCHKTKRLCVIIVKRIAIDMLRKRAVREKDVAPDLLGEEFADDTATLALEEVEERYDLKQAIAKLPERYREVLLLRYRDEYSFAEMAQILGISEDNARKLISRACAKLRVTLTREEGRDK
ncbi:MAG: sigma-70 family RNA polymerase sigma factor [Ruminococcus sp.]|nr:sigma-70 family RNA polymerase sigma factor [Ruminococcus sp.]